MDERTRLHAVQRFGLGPTPQWHTKVGADARGYVLAQLENPTAALIDDEALPPTHEVLQWEMRKGRERRRLRREGGASEEMIKTLRPGPLRRRIYLEEVQARIRKGRETSAPLLERLVMFWSNHFAVSTRKGQVRGIAGAFEREAIRPHVLGRFADMLRAVEQHPAMLIYLENRASAGANSRVGQRRKRGLNENLAREILELHTVTEASGYGQADVTALANLITGWTIARDRAGVDRGGRFQFNPRMHASGAFEVLGKTYRSGSERAGEAVLDDLARHPNTAEHLARKLVTHFIGGNAAPDLVARLATTF
ncbi:MAG: DUF1800 family protein, partial [Pseudomonadota bacterium]